MTSSGESDRPQRRRRPDPHVQPQENMPLEWASMSELQVELMKRTDGMVIVWQEKPKKGSGHVTRYSLCGGYPLGLGLVQIATNKIEQQLFSENE